MNHSYIKKIETRNRYTHRRYVHKLAKNLLGRTEGWGELFSTRARFNKLKQCITQLLAETKEEPDIEDEEALADFWRRNANMLRKKLERVLLGTDPNLQF